LSTTQDIWRLRTATAARIDAFYSGKVLAPR
jgi:hypothetical protein